MYPEINKSDEKVLWVVFEKKKPGYEEEHAHLAELKKKVKLECQRYSKKAIDLTKKAMEKKCAIISAELEKVKELKKRKLVNIAKAVESANNRENVMTEKFLGDVESMVTRFQTELDKMQELFGNIIRNLPQVQVDVAVETR